MTLINRNKTTPLYIQLKEWIVERIEQEEWSYDFKIPTEVELQQKFEISRITVRQAVTELVNEGILEKLQGKGTFVSKQKLEPIRPELTGFTQDMGSKGYNLSSVILDQGFIEADEKLQRIFQLDTKDLIYKLIRLRLVDGVVIGYHEAYINHKVFPSISFSNYDFTKESLYISLQKEGVVWGEADETVEAKPAGAIYGDLLKIDPQAPILNLVRTTRVVDGTPYEYTTMAYRADKYKYSIKLR